MKSCWVYILCSGKNGTLYIGITSDLPRRVYEHKNKLVRGFTSKHSVDRLVHAEEFTYVMDALQREKRLKKWNRKWKLSLIEANNPEWNDLYENIL